MDIEEFYAHDERRRSSIEIELGREWRDATNVRYELSWIEDTGELYIMREPVPEFFEDPLGGFHVDREQIEGLQVHVLCSISSHEHVVETLKGWEAAMVAPDGISWLSAKLDAAGLGGQ
jgi:hypothetical protein